ncbi:hypothetical protein K493DRAFT_308797 [Basidiobolus meristosporus CBS 931.73]|uniref:Uncharacterized protein n=1 Tax=Basidiobolus meristosporus CBS 931.73 TaxID=1314790 RepID=A0A1Y1WX57_9FUNG|nr:hypothetical protein K493DRAFT_308797 [Basidiobolus meristosporus CBS 931.73]|eukprot:ORX77975.1 hypothetical protein K493DRAFT_308797 [Basidiobolus meristosporus CBS 931.73]
MFSANCLLLVLSSALLASSLVVERGYVPPGGLNYCQDLLSHLNTRYHANLGLDLCEGRPGGDGGSDEADLYDPADLLCDALVAKVRALGVKVDANVCIGGLKKRGDDYDEEESERRCRGIVARLKLLKVRANANVCLGKKLEKGVLSNGHDDDDDYSKWSCEDLVRVGRLLGIKVDAKVCLGPILGSNDGLVSILPENGHGGDNGDYNECDDIVARLRLLGLKVDANVCLGIKGARGWSKGDADKWSCDDIVARAKVLGLIKADVNVCLKNVLGGVQPSSGSDGDYDECEDIVARLRLLGLKVDANVCLGIKGASGWSKGDADKWSCDDIVARAKVLGLIKADVNICLKNVLGGGRPSGSDGEHNECDDIVVRLRLLGLKVDANVCLGVKGASDWSKGDADKWSCDDIVARAKVLGLIKADVNICLKNVIGGGRPVGGNDGEHSECDDIIVRLRLLGLKVDANVCLGIKGAGDWSKSRIENSKCEDIVSHAKVLGIIKADVNVCLNNASRPDQIAEHFNECDTIVARLRVLGIPVAANICLNIKVDGKLTKEEIDNMKCEEITAHAKALHILKADVEVCLVK